MSEKNSYNWFKDNVVQFGDRIDRIENVVGVGNPDVNGCFFGTEFWMEIKSPTEPKRPTTKLFGSNHKLSQDQMNWFVRQSNSKGKGYVFIDTDKRRMLIDGCKWGDKINDMTANELAAISMWCHFKPTKHELMDGLRNAIIAGF